MLRCCLLTVIVMWLAAPAWAEIVAREGSAHASVVEYRGGVVGDHDEADDVYPTTTDTLPLQVVARLSDPNEDAAAAVGAQLADPLTATSANPEEFAINLALASIVPSIYYTADAVTEETRTVKFSAAEAGVAEGETASFEGRFYLDLALGAFAELGVTDLTGAEITVTAQVFQETDPNAPTTVFDAQLTLVGGSDGLFHISRSGDFPTTGLFLTDLADVADLVGATGEYETAQLAILTRTALTFPYTATVGEELQLRARVQVTAQCAGNTTVVVAIGHETPTIEDVVGYVRGTATAGKLTTALETERADPTGAAVFTQPVAFGLPVCGLFGIESLLGMLTLAGLRFRTPRVWQRARN